MLHRMFADLFYYLKDKRNFLKNSRVIIELSLSVLVIIVFISFSFIPKTVFNKQQAIIKKVDTVQLPFTPGQPIRWIKTIQVSSLKNGEHFLELPKTAENIKITLLSNMVFDKFNKREISKLTKNDRLRLSAVARERVNSKESLALAKSLRIESSSSFPLLANAVDALDVLLEPTPVNEVVEAVSEVSTPETILLDIVSTPETTLLDIASTPATLTDENATVPDGAQADIDSEQTEGDTNKNKDNDSTDIFSTSEIVPVETPTKTEEEILPEDIQVEYETPAPTMAEVSTDTGKIVTVSGAEITETTCSPAKVEEQAPPLPIIEDAIIPTENVAIEQISIIEPESPVEQVCTKQEIHLTDVLAFTNIPEIYSVGQEDKIKIKWINNNNQDVEFHAYDLDSNGKLDYVEWIVPHLSTQTFEIIFISKAFKLDSDKNIIEDVYESVQAQDDDWTSFTNGQYLRATFLKELNSENDNTIYARPTVEGQSVSIEVYPVYTDQEGNMTEGPLVATFNNIETKDLYKVLLTDLQTPTGVFDLKIIGEVDIDYIVDPSGMLVKYGSFSKPNATTGNQVVTGVGFQPKVVIFFGNSKTGDGSHAGARMYFGAMDSAGHQATMGMQSSDAAANSASDKRWSNTHAITNIIDGTPTVSGEAAYVSMDADGFTINWNTCDATQSIVNYIALAGTDLTNAYVGSFAAPTSINANFAVTGVGFQPDSIILFEDDLTTTPTADVTNAASGVHSLSFIKSTSKKGFSRILSQDAQAIMNTGSYQRTDRVHTTLSGALLEVRIADFVSFDSNGFTLNFSTVAANATYMSYIALKGGQFDVGAFNQNTTTQGTGNQSITGVGFTPSLVMLQSINQASSTSIQNFGRYSFGVATSSSERGSVWMGDTDNVADSVADSYLDRTKSLVMYTEGTPTLTTAMDFVSMDADGFTVNNTTVDATSRQVLYFAVGANQVVAGTPVISSTANQKFAKNDPLTANSTITITDDASNPVITATNDIRIKIPASFNMTWDATDTTATFGGTASAKAGTITYEDSNKTLVVDVTSDFTVGQTLTIAGLSFTSFSASSVSDNLELETTNGGTSQATDDKTIAIGAPTISSVASQIFLVDDPLTANSTITITDDASNPVITATNDIRIKIPASFNMTWDATDTTATFGGTASAKAGTITYEDSNKTLVVDVTSDFTVGQTLTIAGLSFTSFSASSVSDNLELEINNANTSVAENDKTITISPAWWNEDWIYNRTITFANSGQDENLANFPVMVKLTSSNFDFSKARSAGQDLRFIDSDNVTQLSHEIEYYNVASQTAIIWVKIPQIDASSNTDFIYMYYGNSGASDGQNITDVWSNGFAAVYHFAEQSGNYLDSTSNNNDSTSIKLDYSVNSGRDKTDANGLGYYPRFTSNGGSGTPSNTGDYVGIANSASLNFGTNPFTMFFRLKGAITNYDCDMTRKGSTGIAENSWYKIEWGDQIADNRINFLIRTNGTDTALEYDTLAADNVWHNLWGVRSTADTLLKLYIDGSLIQSVAGNNGSVSSSANLSIGAKDTLNDDFCDANMDEARYISGERSADWVAAEDLSFDNAFNTFSAEDSIDTTGPTLVFTDNVASGPVVSDTITATWGDATVTKWDYDTDGVCSTTAGDYTNSSTSITTQTTETNNTKYVCLYAEDSLGNKSTLASANDINIDTTGPTLVFTDNVASGPVVSDTITATWGDATVTKWDYDTDGVCSTTAGDYTNSSTSITTQTTETNNTKYVCLYAEDSLGNKSTLASANDINIDTTGPTLSNVSSSTGSMAKIALNAIPFTTQVTDIIKEKVKNIKDKISETVFDLESMTSSDIIEPITNSSIPKDTPYAFQNHWKISIPNSMKDFVFADLPKDFQNIVNKFPQISHVLEKVEVAPMSNISELAGVSLSLPGLAESIGLPVLSANLSLEQKIKIPSNIVFARTPDEKIDLNVKLSLDKDGSALQTLNTIQGESIKLVVRPDEPAKNVKGYFVFKSSSTAKNTAPISQLASVADAIDVKVAGSDEDPLVGHSTDFILKQFFYKDSGNGVWVADVSSPLTTGQYEIHTIINYKAKKSPKQISMVMLVDPEGYVYQKIGKQEARIPNAKVSIYVLDDKTKEYSLWPAFDFRQENPQITDVTGRYVFLVPPGTYYISATVDSYYDYKGESFKIEEGKGILTNIELKPRWSFARVFNPQSILLVGIFIVLSGIFIAIIRKRSRTLFNSH